MPSDEKPSNRYLRLIEDIFFAKYRKGATSLAFERSDLEASAKKLGIALPKNLGDVIYAIRYRIGLPEGIVRTQPKGKEWVIKGAGRNKYLIELVAVNRILPNSKLLAIKIPDATPEIISAYALSDEQALLAKVRYNRILDIFLGVATYSLQNHLRTSVKGIGQVEIDEIYVGVDRNGRQYIIPVQAKGGKDQLSIVQTEQDLLCCREKFPDLICRSVSAQFIADDLIAIFELTTDDDEIKVVEEKHYRESMRKPWRTSSWTSPRRMKPWRSPRKFACHSRRPPGGDIPAMTGFSHLPAPVVRERISGGTNAVSF